MKENINVNELIKVETLPKIMYQLEIIGKEVDNQLKGVEEMECTEDNKQDVKKRKQNITKFKNSMEERRKEIKSKILEPYDLFNEKYENEIKTKLESAEKTLESKYKRIEQEQKDKKEEIIRDFANEHIKSNNLQDFIKYEDMNINVTLSASEKSLKEQVLKFIEKIVTDIDLINTQEYKEEILIEYKSTLNVSQSIIVVKNRKEALRKIEENKKLEEEKATQEQEIVKNVEQVLEDEITAPREIVEEPNLNEELLEVQFTIKGTKEQIIALKEYIKEHNLQYE